MSSILTRSLYIDNTRGRSVGYGIRSGSCYCNSKCSITLDDGTGFGQIEYDPQEFWEEETAKYRKPMENALAEVLNDND